MDTSHAATAGSSYKSLYKVGATTALLVVVVAVVDSIMGLSGEARGPGTLTAIDWFTLFADNWFLGLANLGLFNMIYYVLTVPTFLALLAAHRRGHQTSAALATIFWLIGVTIYISTNTALPMLSLSGQYAAAATESQKSLLVAAGQAMLAQGEDLTAGAFMGFLIPELATIIMSIVMFRSKVFSKVTALAGILAFGLLMVFNILAAFVPAMFSVAMVFAMSGALFVMAWYVLVARRLFQLGRLEAKTLPSSAAAHAV